MRKGNIFQIRSFTLWALIFAILLGLIMAILKFAFIEPSRVFASETFTLTYENANAGKGPDGEYFSAESFLTDEIIQEALSERGLSEKYTVEQIRKSLSVVGSYPQFILKTITSYDPATNGSTARSLPEDNYYPTQYTIVLYNDFDNSISKNNLTRLVDVICDKYCEAFLETYKISINTDSVADLIPQESHDYTYQLDNVELKLDLIREKAEYLYALRSDYSYNGLSFKDISLKCDSIETQKLDKIVSAITINGLSKSPDYLKASYEYIISMLNLELEKLNDNNTAYETIVNAYEKDATIYITNGENVVKIDGNSSETYDALIKGKLQASEEVASITADINLYTQKLEEVSSTETKTVQLANLENDIQDLNQAVDEVDASFQELINVYNETYINEDIISFDSIQYKSSSVFSASFIKELIMCCGPFCALVVLVRVVFWFVGGVKKYNKKNKVKAE